MKRFYADDDTKIHLRWSQSEFSDNMYYLQWQYDLDDIKRQFWEGYKKLKWYDKLWVRLTTGTITLTWVNVERFRPFDPDAYKKYDTDWSDLIEITRDVNSLKKELEYWKKKFRTKRDIVAYTENEYAKMNRWMLKYQEHQEEAKVRKFID